MANFGAPPPRFVPDDEMRRYLQGQPRGLTRSPIGAEPGLPPAAPVPPPQRSAAVAPPAAPTTAPLAAPVAPAPMASPVPAAQAPAAKPVAPRVAPDVAAYAARRAGPPPKAQGRPTSQTVGSLVAAIAQGQNNQAYDADYWNSLDDRRDAKHKEALAKYEADNAKALALEDADNTSQRSKRAQGTHAPVLRQLGLDDSAIASLSATDIKAIMNGGDAVMSIATAKAKAKAAQEKAAAEAAATAEERKYKEKESDRTSARDFGEGKVLASIQAGNTSQRGYDAAILADELARRREADRRAYDEEQKRLAALRSGKPDPDSYSLPGTDVVNPERFKQVIADDTQRRKMEEEVKANAVIQEGIRRMRDVLESAGTTIKPEDVAAYDSARNMVYGGMTVLGKTGALQTTDIPRYASSLPDITPGVQDVVGLLPGMDNPKAAALRGFESTIGGVIDASLSSSGIRMAPGGAAPPSGSAAPKPSAAPKAAPKPAAPAAGVRIRDPKSGRTGSYPGTAAEAKAEGYEVIGG